MLKHYDSAKFHKNVFTLKRFTKKNVFFFSKMTIVYAIVQKKKTDISLWFRSNRAPFSDITHNIIIDIWFLCSISGVFFKASKWVHRNKYTFVHNVLIKYTMQIWTLIDMGFIQTLLLLYVYNVIYRHNYIIMVLMSVH